MKKKKFILSNKLSIAKSKWIKATLETQYYPSAHKKYPELPPIFQCAGLNKSVALTLADETSILKDDGKTTAQIRMRSRRFDGLLREMAIPHPTTQSDLVLHMEENWNEISHFLKSSNSKLMLSPKKNRIYEMNYATGKNGSSRVLETLSTITLSLNKRYRVTADISKCYPSLYTHSIDWALRGKSVAKKNRNDNSWQHILDQKVQYSQSAETKGVAIGPLTSTVVAEIILQRVDKNLRTEGYRFARYIDDYQAYFNNQTECESFLKDLDYALSEYKLSLNTQKTKIVPIQGALTEEWISYCKISFSSLYKSRALGAIDFLRAMEALSLEYPNKSVMKYALSILTPKLLRKFRDNKTGHKTICMELVRLCNIHPHLIRQITPVLEICQPYMTRSTEGALHKSLEEQLLNSCARGESDVTAWILYTLVSCLDAQLEEETVEKIIKSGDEISITSLAICYPEHRQAILSYVRNLEYNDPSDYQEHWLLRYELFRMRLLKSGDLSKSCEQKWFIAARKNNVRFTTMIP